MRRLRSCCLQKHVCIHTHQYTHRFLYNAASFKSTRRFSRLVMRVHEHQQKCTKLQHKHAVHPTSPHAPHGTPPKRWCIENEPATQGRASQTRATHQLNVMQKYSEICLTMCADIKDGSIPLWLGKHPCRTKPRYSLPRYTERTLPGITVNY